MAPILAAATRYALTVFAAGFLLGAFRVLWLAPRLGPTAAVALELPLILAVAWIACRRTATSVPTTPRARLAMGGIAFLLLMAAEALIGTAFGRGLAAQIRELTSAAGLLGLAGQIAFALFPLLQLRAGPRS